jgi:hypothetical protein
MKRYSLVISIVIGAGVLSLCAVPVSAQFQVVLASGSPGAITITDNGAGDTDPKPDRIGFNRLIAVGGGASFDAVGHVVQSITAKSIEVRFDRLQLDNPSAFQVTMTTVEARSAVFPAVGPPFAGRVHLDGAYSTDQNGVRIANARVTLDGSVVLPAALPIGTIAVPAAVDKQRPVRFNPPDVSKKLAIGATQVRALLTFDIAPHDRIVMPGSAVVAGYTYDRELDVNSTADLADGLPGDGVCDTGNQNIGFTGVCTLRAALTEADQQAVITAIHFNISGSGIPKIVMSANTTFNFGSMGALQQVIVDGTTQPAGQVEVDGSQSSPKDIGGSPIVGLDLVGQKSTVLGMVIHSFPSHGIVMRQSGSPFGGSNVVEDSLIGTDPTGQIPLPNGGDGIHISQMPSNLIEGNVIASNAAVGVSVEGSAATGNRIHANSIVGNGGLGISLSNSGNNLEAAPSLTSPAVLDVTDLTVAGTVHGGNNVGLKIDFYGNHSCDASGSGEGETYLGSTDVMTDGSGNASFNATMPADLSSNDVVTATATDSDGNTSAFSVCASITQTTPPNQPPIANAGPDQTVPTGSLVTLNGSGSSDPDNGPGSLTFHWAQVSGPVVTLAGANTATPSFTASAPGSYVFSLVVNDGAVDSSPDSVTITVTAGAIAAQIQSLMDQVESLGLPKGQENSLEAKLRAALASVQRGNESSASGQLGAFINEVEAQRGKKIPSADADALIAAAQQIIAELSGA